ncbi:MULTISPECIES: IucA/IucC family protein [unclassified Brenneria]|uniref:IucA/IucC family protein n=1 Tax=unclassified Brenneria TaxID=2634434 RepID=UPI001F229A2C|nr:IucA/IucC family protein [Brenneria sp. L3-3C-1]MEE3645191.1 IucA/IucC family protein [Brenneria sp. L3_3C_1]
MMNHQDYITLRIINASLREDVSALVSRGDIRRQDGEYWLYAAHLNTPLRIQVQSSDYMQSWVAVAPRWQIPAGEGWQTQTGYADWLALLMPDRDDETRQLYASYQQEADAACEQGELCHQAFLQQRDDLARPLPARSWGERLRHADQMASYLDHPYYPTARAKFGFSTDQLSRYAPEFCSPFLLRWLAVPAASLTLTRPGAHPDWWPSFAQVGLACDLRHSHTLIPVHPLTWEQLSSLPDDAIAAPLPWLNVYPTLSVRTVQLADFPDTHIKIPLAMRTLGQKNIRLIKPSTLYDGQWFAQVLPQLAARDPMLQGRYRHVDESFCGHLGDEKLFAFLVRRYPQPRQDETLAPVAALGSAMPDGRAYLEFVLDQPGMPALEDWWQDYCQLMSDVHLTLWLRYGIALESNQQNAIISFTPGQPPSLVMKDNDAARLWPQRFAAARPDLQARVAELLDERIRVEDERALAQMFITITLQLDLAAVLENLADRGALDRRQGYHTLRQALLATLRRLDRQGVDTRLPRQILFEETYQPVKYLLLSGSLLSKQASGAADINKYYGQSGPNFLRQVAE